MMTMLLPRLILFRKEVVLLWKAFRSPHTPLYLKLATVFAALYLVSPFDIVTDFIPLLGWVDDLILVPMMVSWIVTRLPVPAYAGQRRQTVEGKAHRL